MKNPSKRTRAPKYEARTIIFLFVGLGETGKTGGSIAFKVAEDISSVFCLINAAFKLERSDR